MTRSIFVGSSVEGLDEARRLCDLLSTFDEIEYVLWTDVFEPGFLTFEALENMMLRCCAAVFIATPDDQSTIRHKKVLTPRANVMLEFGLVAGRLGRHNIALCQYGGAVLPSDLRGLTVIEMSPASSEKASEAATLALRQRGEQALRTWSAHLVATAERITRTDIVHGYTGRWSMDVGLSQWRNLPIALPSYVHVYGLLDLYINPDGHSGRGLGHFRLNFNLYRAEGTQRPYAGEFRTSHEITNVLCERDGSVGFTSVLFAVQRVTATGQPWPELAGLDELPEPWPFYWRVTPTVEPYTLQGTVTTGGGVETHGTVKAVLDVY